MELKDFVKMYEEALEREDVDSSRRYKSIIADYLMVRKALDGSTQAIIELYKDSKVRHKITPQGQPNYDREELENIKIYGDYVYRNYEGCVNIDSIDSIKLAYRKGALNRNEAHGLIAFHNKANEAELIHKLEMLEEKLM